MKLLQVFVALVAATLATSAVAVQRGPRPLNAYPPQSYSFRETQRATQHAAEHDQLEFGASAAMMVRDNRCPNGNSFLKCPFATGTCCGQPGFAQACCPTGYSCDQRAAGWHCVAGSASTQNAPASRPVTTISPTIVIGGANGGASPSTSASTTNNKPTNGASNTDDSADDSSSGNGNGNGSDSDADAFKPKQNIIIVKNINVLTKGVAPAASVANKDAN